MRQKKNRGNNFTQENVCKFYLLGFCPQHELHNSKLTTKRNLGECAKVHSDAMKAEFEAHPDKAKHQAEYERAFLPFLEGQVREADAWVARERANAQKVEANNREKTTINTMPVSVKEQLDQLNEDVNKMMAAAENLAEKGDIEGSKFKVVLAEEIKNKVKEIEAKHPSYTVTSKEEWVCDVCGTRTEAVTDSNQTRFAAHFKGKVHLGYAKIRDWVKDLRQKQRDAEGKRGSSRDRDNDRRRRRSRSRGEKQGGGREEERKRRRSRSRSRGGHEGGEHDRKRRRSRSKEERQRAENSEATRHRSRSRERGRRRGRSEGDDRSRQKD